MNEKSNGKKVRQGTKKRKMKKKMELEVTEESYKKRRGTRGDTVVR